MFAWVNEEFRIDSKVPSPFKPRFQKFMTGSFRLRIGIISVAEIISMVGIISVAVQGLVTSMPDLTLLRLPNRSDDRRLIKKGESFIFGPAQQATFAELKQGLTQANTLGYFDRIAKTKIITDAIPVGLVAVLVQEHRRENHLLCYQGIVRCGTRLKLFANGEGSVRQFLGLQEVPRLPLWNRIRALD